ncbi:Uncharacterised protein [Bartonella vinsonii]|uniref:Uncharacterized protein n=1 Tax=Bartonella vinsonii TaxID=33047 RepID=A0A3S5C6Q8_BARVI|nr:Uncharacterised protein [Bartonella vinsonii]
MTLLENRKTKFEEENLFDEAKKEPLFSISSVIM